MEIIMPCVNFHSSRERKLATVYERERAVDGVFCSFLNHVQFFGQRRRVAVTSLKEAVAMTTPLL